MRELRRSALFFMLCDEDNAGEGVGKRWGGWPACRPQQSKGDKRLSDPSTVGSTPKLRGTRSWMVLPTVGRDAFALAGEGFFFTGGGGGLLLAFYFGPASALRIGDGATSFGAELAAWLVGGNVGGVAARLAGPGENGADLAKLRDFFINGLQNLVVQGRSFRGWRKEAAADCALQIENNRLVRRLSQAGAILRDPCREYGEGPVCVRGSRVRLSNRICF